MTAADGAQYLQRVISRLGDVQRDAGRPTNERSWLRPELSPLHIVPPAKIH
jgi:hypothetical protein